MKPMKTWHRRGLMITAALVTMMDAQAIGAGPGYPGLPPAAEVSAVLARSPAVLAALRGIEAEQAVHRQYQLGSHEWTGSLSAVRRTPTHLQADRSNLASQEWELGLDRGVRLPGKAAVYDRAGRLKVAQADAAKDRVWREHARLLLDGFGSWWRERESARVWMAHESLLHQQLDSVARRQQLGGAAKIEQRQAQAALAQSRAQLQAAVGRARAAADALQQHFPALNLADLQINTALPAPQALNGDEAKWLPLLNENNPELALARRVTASAEAALQLEMAERHGDPTVGVRVGRALSGAERVVGVVISMPFGGDYRAAGAAAATSRAAAAAQLEEQARRSASAAGVQHLRVAQTTYASWLANSEAAQQLADAADSIARGYALGEGVVADMLTARRLANEQQLITAMSAVDAWISRHRLALEAGQLWNDPATKLDSDVAANGS